MIAFEQISDADHHIKGGVVVTALGKGAAMQSIAQVEEIQFREPVALLSLESQALKPISIYTL